MAEQKDRSGAESLVQTFVDAGVNVCFANPGTSEMHFVAALDSNPDMRCVLGLFEGVVTGAADGYGRMRGIPAATLLHLGPGLGNGLANLHNAKKARTPLVNVIGDHATYHRKYDAPLTSDVEGIARPVSGWVKVSTSADAVAADGAEAIQAALAPPGQVASLILPADTAWSRTTAQATPLAPPARTPVDADAVSRVAAALRSGEPAVLLMNGPITESRAAMADRIAQATGARVLMDTFIPRVERGAGRVALERLPYFGEQAAEVLAGTRHLILISTQPPVTFFAYPDKPNWLTPEGCELHTLIERDGDIDGALEALADAVAARALTPRVAAPAQTRLAVRQARPGKHRCRVGPPVSRKCHRGGRKRHFGVRHCHGDPRRAAPRLAHAHRGLHRLRPAHGGGSGCGLSRSPRDQPGSRRQRYVHGAVPLDHGPGKPGCHDCCVFQPPLRHSADRVRPRRGPTTRARKP